jgi:integrase
LVSLLRNRKENLAGNTITPAELRDWLYALPLSGQTINHIRYSLKIIFKEAIFAAWIKTSPVDLIDNVEVDRKVRDAFNIEDLQKLLPRDNTEKLIQIWGDVEIAAAFIVLASTGLRSGELRGLAWRHYIPERSALIIERSVKFLTHEIGSTKTGKERMVYLWPGAKDSLEYWKSKSPWTDAEDFIFPGPERGKPVNDNLLRTRLTRALKRAEVDTTGRYLVVHSFRHSYVTRAREKISASALQLTSGHEDEKTSKGYFHPSVQDRLKQLDAAADSITAAVKW